MGKIFTTEAQHLSEYQTKIDKGTEMCLQKHTKNIFIQIDKPIANNQN